LKIAIDLNRCQGHNLCLSYVPELLDADDVGFVSVAGDGTVPLAVESDALTARDNCPEQAITVCEGSKETA
jgi:ferredoxin